jgi:MFS family permease
MSSKKPSQLQIVNIISFLLGFSQAVLIYVVSSYFKEQSGQDNVSIFYLVAYAGALYLLLNFHYVVRAVGKSQALFFSLAVEIAMLLVVLFSHSRVLNVYVFIIYLVSSVLLYASLDIILESLSTDQKSGRIRGKFLTIINIGFIFGPFVSAYIMNRWSYAGIFVAVLIFRIIILLIAMSRLDHINHNYPVELSVKDIFNKFLKRKNIVRIYYISCVLEFFYALMVIYTPIYLRNLGLSWGQISVIFTTMLIPFVINEYPIGWLADKKWGEKEMIIFFLIWTAIATGAIYFIHSNVVWIWAIALLLTRIGAASLEILRDSYFFKKIDGQDVGIINFYRTASSVGLISAALFSSIALLFLPVSSTFILTAAVLLSALVPAVRLVDNEAGK